jgi:hypothetical protein
VVDARRDVAPLVRAARLEQAAVRLVEMKKIVRLQERVAEFGEADAGRCVHARFDAVLGHHGVDGEMLSHVAQKIEHANGAHPVGIVEQQRGMGRALEIEEAAQLALDARDVGLEDFG